MNIILRLARIIGRGEHSGKHDKGKGYISRKRHGFEGFECKEQKLELVNNAVLWNAVLGVATWL